MIRILSSKIWRDLIRVWLALYMAGMRKPPSECSPMWKGKTSARLARHRTERLPVGKAAQMNLASFKEPKLGRAAFLAPDKGQMKAKNMAWAISKISRCSAAS